MDKTTHNEDSHRKRANPARCRQCGDIIDVGDEANCIHMRDGFPVEDRWHEYKCRTIKSGSQEVQHFYQVAPRASAPQIKPEVSATPVPIRTEANVPSVNFIVVHDRDGGKMERLTKAVEGMTEVMRDLPEKMAKCLPRHAAAETSPQKVKPKRKPKPSGRRLKGPKTPFMHEQLREFKRYMANRGYQYDAKLNYPRARGCWKGKDYPDKSNPGETKNRWDDEAAMKGDRRGYSCYKTLADAYGRLLPEQRNAL